MTAERYCAGLCWWQKILTGGCQKGGCPDPIWDLGKLDLKSARLGGICTGDLHQSITKSPLIWLRIVSKSWCFCASVYPFNDLYISANEVDLDDFIAVARHPIIWHHVRSLQFGGTAWIPEMSKRRYLEEPRKQRPLSYADYEVCAHYSHCYSYPDLDTRGQCF